MRYLYPLIWRLTRLVCPECGGGQCCPREGCSHRFHRPHLILVTY